MKRLTPITDPNMRQVDQNFRRVNQNFEEVLKRNDAQDAVANTLSYVHVDGTGFTGTADFTSLTPTATGYKITLPTAGTWLVICKARVRIDTSAGARYIRAFLYHEGTQVDESICLYSADDTTYHRISNELLQAVVVADANDEVELYGAVSNTTGVTYARAESDGNGYTTFTAIKIG